MEGYRRGVPVEGTQIFRCETRRSWPMDRAESSPDPARTTVTLDTGTVPVSLLSAVHCYADSCGRPKKYCREHIGKYTSSAVLMRDSTSSYYPAASVLAHIQEGHRGERMGFVLETYRPTCPTGRDSKKKARWNTSTRTTKRNS